MRIAPAKRLAVQSLGRHSVGNTGFEGEAALASTIGKTALDLGQKAAQAMDRREQQKADLEVQEAERSFQKQFGGREFIDASELSDSMRKGYKDGERVPSAQVLPQMYKEHVDKVLMSASQRITIAGSKNSWMSAKSTVASSRINKLQAASNSAIEKQIFTDQKIEYQNAIDDRNPKLAEEIAKGMNGSDIEIADFVQNAKEKSEIVTYEDIVSEQDVAGIEAAIEMLESNSDAYAASGGKLDSDSKMKWAEKMRSELRRIQGTTKAINKYQREKLNYDIKTLTDNVTDGQEFDMDYAHDLKRRMDAMNELTEGEYTKELLELEDTVNAGLAIGRMTDGNRAEREAVLKTSPLIYEDDHRNKKHQQRLKTANDKFTIGENTDAMKTWSDAGKFKLSTINMDAPPAMVGNQFGARLQQFETAQQKYGTDVGQGLLTSQEAKAISQKFEGMKPVDQQNFLLAAHQGMGLKSKILYSQLAKDGEARTFAIAGMATSAGNMAGSANMLRGSEYRKANFDELKDVKATIDSTIIGDLDNAYYNSPGKREAIKAAIFDAYVGYSMADNSFLQVTDGDKYDKAVRDATGGLFSHGGDTLPNPVYGMADNEMENWIADTTSEHVTNTGGPPEGMGTDEFWKNFQDGDFTMKGSSDTNEYIIMRGDVPLRDKDGGAYTLKYDASSPKKEVSNFDATYRWVTQ